MVLNTLKRLISDPIMIGINPNMAPEMRHGVVHVHGKKASKQLGFLADSPERLRTISQAEVNGIFHQVKQLGFSPMSLEIPTPDGKVAFFQYVEKKVA